MRTTGEVARFSPPEIGTIRTIESSEEATGEVTELATPTPATADPINMAAMVRLTMVLVMFFSSWLRGWLVPSFCCTHFTGEEPSRAVTHCRWVCEKFTPWAPDGQTCSAADEGL